MKILFLNNYHYLRGGSERIFFGEMQMFEEDGHTVAAFSRKSPQDTDSAPIPFFPPHIETASFKFTLSACLTVREIIYSTGAKKKLNEMIETFRPDVAHAHNIYGRLTTSVLDLLHENDIPIVMTLHDMKLLCPSYLMLNHGNICERCKGKRFYNAILTKCHKDSYLASAIYSFETWFNHFLKKYDKVRYFIAPSHFLLEKHLEYGFPVEKFVYLPSFIDTIHIKPSYGQGKYFLYVGRLSTEKGIDTLLKAYSKLQNKIPLLIVGEGPERNHLEAQGIAGVRFTGYLTGKTLHNTISNARCIVIPSECYENSPLSVLEAMAFGKPVIGSRIGGIPELIEDQINGFVFKPHDIDDLTTTMDTLMNKSENAIINMGKAGRQKAEKQFSVEAHYHKLLALYNKALSNTK